LIGHLAPLSGPGKRLGQQARQAILLAVKEANEEENRIAGRRVAVLHIDSHGDLDALQPEAVRLITVNHVVALLGGVNAAEVERLGHAAQPYEVALITPAAVPAEQMADNVFSVNASLAFQGQVLARFAATELKAKQVALWVDGRRAANVVLAEAFNKELRAARQWVYNSEADLKKTIEESKEMEPQAILFAGSATEAAKARTLLQAAGLTAPVLLAEDGEQLAALEAEPKLSNHVYLATPYGATELQEFAKKYEARFHESPAPDSGALLAYDGVQVLLQGMRQAKLTSSANAAAKVRDALAGSNEFKSLTGEFKSLTGPLFFNKDHSARRLLFVVHFENGKMREAKRFDPDPPPQVP